MGATAVTITHDMTTVRTVADRVAMLHDGVDPLARARSPTSTPRPTPTSTSSSTAAPTARSRRCVEPAMTERAALRLSAAAALLIGVLGLAAALATGSGAILLDGLFNLTFFATALLTLRVATLVARPDDEPYPFGYIFFEPLITTVKGLLILGVSPSPSSTRWSRSPPAAARSSSAPPWPTPP